MNILSFGSLGYDHTYSVPHFTQSGETLAAQQLRHFCGGKGLNQTIALARAGASVSHAGRVGRDGGILLELLRSEGVDASLVCTDPDQDTGHAIIQVTPDGQNSILIYGGANRTMTPGFIDQVLDRFAPGDMVLFQNEIDCLDLAVSRAAQRGLLIALNPSPMDQSLLDAVPLELVRWLILNEPEGQAISGAADPEPICRAIRARCPHSAVVLTLGPRGALWFDGGAFLFQPGYAVPVVDTTGAGDTFTGYFLAALASGAPPSGALELGCRAAALSVCKPGASPSIPTRAEVDAAHLPRRA